MIDRFYQENKGKFQFDTLKDRKARKDVEKSLTLDRWIKERDSFIKEEFEVLPMCMQQIFLVDKLTITSKSTPPVKFDVVVRIILPLGI